MSRSRVAYHLTSFADFISDGLCSGTETSDIAHPCRTGVFSISNEVALEESHPDARAGLFRDRPDERPS